jgi:pimeloyl-ACP methyl ester carboxylesterase
MSNSQHSFYFGKTGAALLGVYYPPAGDIPHCNQGVLLCPAFGQEFLRSHRAFRQLGLLLARAGLHVLRFDYFGTGDSAGALRDASISRWLDDISAARAELVNISGAQRVSATGLRLGATLSLMQAARDQETEWHSITLWEPVVNGQRYLETFGHTIRQPIENIMGFPITSKLRDEIAALDLNRLPAITTPQIHCVSSSSDAELEQLLSQLRKSSQVFDTQIPIDGDWSRTDEFLSAMLPREMIARIVAGLTEQPVT